MARFTPANASHEDQSAEPASFGNIEEEVMQPYEQDAPEHDVGHPHRSQPFEKTDVGGERADLVEAALIIEPGSNSGRAVADESIASISLLDENFNGDQAPSDTVENPEPEDQSISSPLEDFLRSEVLRDVNMDSIAHTYISNSLARARVREQLRDKDTWSWDWVEPLKMLSDALQSSRETDDHLRQDTNEGSKDPSIEVKNTDYIGVRVQHIPIPSEWTKESFAQYVHNLCRSRMPRSGPKIERKHHQKVRKCLETQIFTNSNSELMSSTVFESALKFYYRFELLPSVRQLFHYMQQIEYPYSNACFDTVLRNAASQKDLHNFTALLKGALELGFTPGPKTWTSLVLCLQSDQSTQVVLDLMFHHNLCGDLSVRQDLAGDILNRTLFKKPFTREKVKTILNTVDGRLDKDWFCLKTANIILKYLCLLPNRDQINKLFQLMIRKDCPPNLDSLNIVLRRCLRRTDLKTAIDVMAYFMENHKVVPDELSYNLLFELAWTEKSINVCRVVWAAACMHGRVAWSMEKLISDSITAEGTGKSSTNSWRSTAGYLVLGLGPRQVDVQWFANLAPLDASDPDMVDIQRAMLNLAKEETDTTKDSANFKMIQKIMRHDQGLIRRFLYPVSKIKSDLRTAFRRDKEWIKESFHDMPFEVQVEKLIQPTLTDTIQTYKWWNRDGQEQRSNVTGIELSEQKEHWFFSGGE